MGRVRDSVRQLTRWPAGMRPSRVSVAILVVSFAVYVGLRWVTHPSSIDLEVYRVEGQAVRSGLDLYGHLPTPLGSYATYPPFAAILFVPLTLISAELMRALVVALNLVLLMVVALLACRLVGIDPRRHATAACLLAAVTVWSEPVFTTLRYGQINLLLLVLVLWDFTRPAGSRTAGIGVGIAAGIKVTPGFFIVYLLLTGRVRMAATSIVSFVVTIGLSALVIPHAAWHYWTDLLFNTSRVGRLENAANQSLRGVMVRMTHTRASSSGELLVVAVVLVAGLACAVLAYRRLGDRWGLPACAVTSLLITPIAWTHHWVWCIPIALLLWQEARAWIPAVAIFWTFAVWAIPHANSAELHFSAGQIAVSGWYVLFGLVFLALTGWKVWRRQEKRADLVRSELVGE